MASTQQYLHSALNHLSENQWEAAHVLIQNGKSELHCLIHGLVHRMEGDLSNAAYWYNKAKQEVPQNTIAEEILRLKALLPN